MRRILVLAEGAGESARELLAAARGLGEIQAEAVLLGTELDAPAAVLGRDFPVVHCFEDPALDPPDGDLAARVLAAWLAAERFDAVLLAHTNNGLDLAPALAGLAGMPMLADCVALAEEDGRLTAVRPVFGGKLHARVRAAASPAGVLVTVRPGAFAAGEAGSGQGEIRRHPLPEGVAPRRRFVETVAPAPGAVDITQAEVLVAVGRGIEDEENLDLVRPLVEALGAELACTRPVVDRGWLEKSRQVGTSGATVRPRVYLALGVSGSFQHLGGIQGRPFLAAINKDPAAPIFAVADVGIVGDLLELVPLLTDKIADRRD